MNWLVRLILGGGPALLGLGLIIFVVAEGGITRSPATISTTLVVGAILIVVPMALFVINAEAYEQFEARLAGQLRRLLREELEGQGGSGNGQDSNEGNS